MATYKIDAPQVRNLNEFWSVIKAEKELAAQNRFMVQIAARPNSTFERDLIYLCMESELPGRTFQTGNEIRYYGPSFKLPVMSEYQEMELTFIVREYLSERLYFDRWLEKINPKSTYDFSYRSDYETEIHIYQYSDIYTGNNKEPLKAVYRSTLRHAWPLSVSSMPLSWAPEGLHKLKVTFTYTDWYNYEEKDHLKPSVFQLVNNARIER